MIFIFDITVDYIEENYVFDGYEDGSSSLKEEYDELEDLKKVINEFFSLQMYRCLRVSLRRINTS